MESRQRPAILLLPGMDGTGVLFRALRRAMEPTVDVHVVEYPTDGPCDYRAALQHAQDRLAALPACHIVGWSFSGPIALCLARSQPDRVRSVTLVATFVQSPLASLRWVAPLMFSPLVGIARAVRRLPVWLGRAADDPVRRDKAELWRRVGARTLAARARASTRRIAGHPIPRPSRRPHRTAPQLGADPVDPRGRRGRPPGRGPLRALRRPRG